MSKENQCTGVIVPMVTPVTENGEIDLVSTHRLITYIIENGAAPFVLGTTGESASVSSSQRLLLVRQMVESTGQNSLTYAGISSNSLETSLEMARAYLDLGLDVVVAHPPCYYPLNDDMMLRYFEKLVEKLPGPLILYNIPQVTHCSMSLEVVDHLSYHQKIIGIKDSERDLERLKRSLLRWSGRSDFVHVVGWGAQMNFGLLNGSSGIIPSSGNIAPRLYADLFQMAIKQNISELNRLQDLANQISAVYQRDRTLGHSLAALKVMLHHLGICEPHVLPPLQRLTLAEEDSIIREMSKFEILNPVIEN